jgi:hypothetical protein
MKRIIVLTIIAALTLTGCETTRDQLERQGSKKENISDLPYPTMHYNDVPLELKSIDLYQSYDDSDYQYNPYCVVRIDASKASDEDLHYLCNADLGQSRDPYMEIDCYYTSESNKIKLERMNLISHYKDDDDLVYLFYDYMQEDAIHSLEDMKVDVDIEIIQSNGELVKMYDTDAAKYSYDININGTSNIKLEVKDDTEIPQSENSMFEKGFGEIIQRGF